MTIVANPLLLPGLATIYPESDGAPLGETETHVRLTTDLYIVLREYLAKQRGVYVGCDMFVYYQEGDPRGVVCPDLFVAFGVKPGVRRTFKTWVEGTFPGVIIEVTSKESQVVDAGAKPGFYAMVGVDEYFLIDPLGEYLPTQLIAMRRRGSRLVEMPNRPTAAHPRRFTSRRLGLDFCLEGKTIRLVETRSGRPLPWPHEMAEARQRAEQERQREAEARQRAEAEVERLRNALAGRPSRTRSRRKS